MNASPSQVPTEALVAVAQLVVAGAGHHRLTGEAVRATARTLDADRCEILRLASEGEELLRVASCGKGGKLGTFVRGGVSSVAGYALLCGAPVFSDDLGKEPRFGEVGGPCWEGPVSAVASPVPGRGEAFGALVAYAARASAFDARHAISVSRIASLLGGALQRLEEHEELRRRAAEVERCYASPDEARIRLSERDGPVPTVRQLEVLRLMADGRPAKSIASELGISIHTVHFHQRNLYRALGVSSSTAALKSAAETGLLRPPDSVLADR